MPLSFQLTGAVTGVGRSLELVIEKGAAFSARFEINPDVADAAAVTEVIGTYLEAIETAEITIGDALRMVLGNAATTKITKRTADPYAYLMEAEMVSVEGPSHARGTFEMILQQRTDVAPAHDVDDLAPPVVQNYRDRRWRIWLVYRGAPPTKIEGVLDA